MQEKCQAYAKQNAQKVASKKAEWYRENVERLTAKRAVYNREHRTQTKLALARYYQANTETHKAASREWAKTHPNSIKVISHNSMARVSGKPQRLTSGVIERLWVQQNGECKACLTSLDATFHIDHIVPTARGGLNLDLNIQLLCATYNQKKWALPNEEFLARLRTTKPQGAEHDEVI